MTPAVGVVEVPRSDGPAERRGRRGAPPPAPVTVTGGHRPRHALPAMPAVAAAVLARSENSGDLPELDFVIPDSVWPEELGGTPQPAPPQDDQEDWAQEDETQEDWPLDGLLQRAVDARLQRKAKDTKALCPRYDGYDKSKDVGTYNCAGLAWRTYDFRGDLTKERDAVAAGKASGKAGNLKLWFWEYDLHLETDDGRRGPEAHDFHMVGGIVDKAGKDPDDVYTKNGGRPVHGPGTGPGFKPAARDRATSNDPSDTPQSAPDGAPLYKVRSNFKETVKYHPCPSP